MAKLSFIPLRVVRVDAARGAWVTLEDDELGMTLCLGVAGLVILVVPFG